MPDLTLDHVIIGVEDLQASANKLELVLGRRPSWHGRHPTYGTANVLFRLGSSYLELLAPDPEAATDTAWTGSLGRFLRERGEGLFSIALQTYSIGAAAVAIRGRGLPLEDPLAGSGIDLQTGAVREWVNARIPPEATRGTRCFLIEHRSPAAALPASGFECDEQAAVVDTVGVLASSREVEGARRMWRDIFGLTESRAPEAIWRFDLGNATLFLQTGSFQEPGGSESPPDSWQALLMKVANLDAVAERLHSSAIDGTRGHVAGLPGIWVEVCGVRLLLTEAQ